MAFTKIEQDFSLLPPFTTKALSNNFWELQLPHLPPSKPTTEPSNMNIDFRFAKAGDSSGIQQMSKHYLCNTVMVLAHDVPSTLENIQDNMPFPYENDGTAAFPTYLPVPVLVARDTNDERPLIVGYAFLGPCRKSTIGDASSTLELFLFVHPDYVGNRIGSSLLSMLLMLVQSDRGVSRFEWVATEENGSVQYLRRGDMVQKVVAVVSIDPDAAEGGEWLPRWLETKKFKGTRRVKNMALGVGKWIDTAYLQWDVPKEDNENDSNGENDSGYGGDDNEGSVASEGSVESVGSISSEGSGDSYVGSEGSQWSQGSQTSVSSEGSDNESNDEDEEDSEEDEDDDWDDEDDPHGEVEDDDIEFD